MMILLAFLVGILAGYNLAKYDAKYPTDRAVRAEIKVGKISTKGKEK